MSQPLRIAMFVGMFPVVSETFILRQIKALLDLGHEVEIFAETRGDTTGPLHSEVAACRLLERTTFLDLPLVVNATRTSPFCAKPQTWRAKISSAL